jgi:para-nitrobenzyl esterase
MWRNALTEGTSMTTDEIKTSGGTVRGVVNDGVAVFRGIPYGDDTSAENRFRPPRPPRPWTGVRDCIDYGPSCPQMTVEQMLGIPLPPESESLMGTRSYERVMGEDCLVLNVFTPADDPTAGLPVLVWLHGGAWATGSASWPVYEFDNLARNGDVVVVGINHRVGILGFLDLSSISDEFADSGNVGMLDVVAALGWIRDNIVGFGGDPNNVTVFGESGGGAKVAALLAMPGSQGLLHKAMAMSGSMLQAQLPERAAVNTNEVIRFLQIDRTIDALQAANAARLVEAEVDLPGRTANAINLGRGFSPVLGPSLPQHPAHAIRGGINREVTLVSGCNNDETVAFVFSDPELFTMDIDGACERLRPACGDDTARVLSSYQAILPDDSPTSLFIAASTDKVFRVPQIRLAEAKLAGGGANTYMYLFTWGFADPEGAVRSPHGVDMPYFFDNVDKAPAAEGPHAAPLASMMSGTLIALAHTGAPGHEGLPTWPGYTLDERATMCIDLEPAVVNDPRGAQRRVWDGIDLPGLRGE